MATENITLELADKVAAEMLRAEATRLKLADLTGIPYTTLGRKIRGQTSFTVEELFLIASALKIAPVKLLPMSLLSSQVAA